MKQKNKHWKRGDSIICIRYYYRSRKIKRINEKTLELIREFNKVSGYKVSESKCIHLYITITYLKENEGLPWWRSG